VSGAPAKSIGYLYRLGGRNCRRPQNVRGILFEQRSGQFGLGCVGPKFWSGKLSALSGERSDRRLPYGEIFIRSRYESVTSAFRRQQWLVGSEVSHGSAVAVGASYRTKLVLAFRSGDVCAFPGCGKRLTYEAKAGPDTHIGEAAHICGEKPAAARYDASMTNEERDDVRNLIYLCADHHTIIDKVEADWSTSALKTLKGEHESRVRQAIEAAFADIAFPELQNAVSRVAEQAPAANGSFDLTAPDEKIKKNALSNGSRHIIAAGLTRGARERGGMAGSGACAAEWDTGDWLSRCRCA
jgi:hypothetical protein